MNFLRTHSSAIFLSTAVMLLAFSATGSAQTLKDKLSQRVAFVPHSSSTLDQLVEISQQFQIPMGIEIDEDGSETDIKTPAPSTSSQRTVQEFIDHILQRTPGYKAEQNAGVLNIAKPTLAASPKNFLNISIPQFQLSHATLFDAEGLLRLKLEMFLHPERYAHGWNGGWGHAPGGPFDVENITFSGRNLTVRQILNAIVAANGNALWIVPLTPSKTTTMARFYSQAPYTTEGEERFYWQFIPLRGDQRQK